MNKLILVRAGRTAWYDERRLQGTVPLPLSPEGEHDLDALAAQLQSYQPDVIYSSGNESAGPTAAYLAEKVSLKARKIAGFHEVHCGLWQGLRREELQRRYGKAFRQWCADPGSVTPPEAESLEDAQQRLAKALTTLAKKTRGKTVVLVLAEMVGAIIQTMLTDQPLSQLWALIEQWDGFVVFQGDNERTFGACSTIENRTTPEQQPELVTAHKPQLAFGVHSA